MNKKFMEAYAEAMKLNEDWFDNKEDVENFDKQFGGVESELSKLIKADLRAAGINSKKEAEKEAAEVTADAKETSSEVAAESQPIVNEQPQEQSTDVVTDESTIAQTPEQVQIEAATEQVANEEEMKAEFAGIDTEAIKADIENKYSEKFINEIKDGLIQALPQFANQITAAFDMALKVNAEQTPLTESVKFDENGAGTNVTAVCKAFNLTLKDWYRLNDNAKINLYKKYLSTYDVPAQVNASINNSINKLLAKKQATANVHTGAASSDVTTAINAIAKATITAVNNAKMSEAWHPIQNMKNSVANFTKSIVGDNDFSRQQAFNTEKLNVIDQLKNTTNYNDFMNIINGSKLQTADPQAAKNNQTNNQNNNQQQQNQQTQAQSQQYNQQNNNKSNDSQNAEGQAITNNNQQNDNAQVDSSNMAAEAQKMLAQAGLSGIDVNQLMKVYKLLTNNPVTKKLFESRLVENDQVAQQNQQQGQQNANNGEQQQNQPADNQQNDNNQQANQSNDNNQQANNNGEQQNNGNGGVDPAKAEEAAKKAVGQLQQAGVTIELLQKAGLQ